MIVDTDKDLLKKGTWIVNTAKHIVDLKTSTVELAAIETTEEAGKAGLLLSKLVADNDEIIKVDKAKGFARLAGITSGEFRTYIDDLKIAEKLDYTRDVNGNINEIEIYCFSQRDALETVGKIFDNKEPREYDKANIYGLIETFKIPKSEDELKGDLARLGISEEGALKTLELQELFGLVKTSGEDRGEKVYYNEYSFNSDPTKVVKALGSLDEAKRNDVLAVIDIITKNQGYLEDFLLNEIDKTTLDMMESLGIIDGITVNSDINSSTFYTTPQLKGEGVGVFNLSNDVFHKAKILLSCLRFGQIQSYYSRGKIDSNSKMMNIINKLLRGDWVGPATAIGNDYTLLELDGVIKTIPGPSYGFLMQLRQKEVGVLVKQMIQYNQIFEDGTNNAILIGEQPSSYVLPEKRKKEIEALGTQTIEKFKVDMLHTIRSGGLD